MPAPGDGGGPFCGIPPAQSAAVRLGTAGEGISCSCAAPSPADGNSVSLWKREDCLLVPWTSIEGEFGSCPGECCSNQPYNGQKYQSDRSQQQKAGKSDRLVIMLRHTVHLWIAISDLIQLMHELSIRTCVCAKDQMMAPGQAGERVEEMNGCRVPWIALGSFAFTRSDPTNQHPERKTPMITASIRKSLVSSG